MRRGIKEEMWLCNDCDEVFECEVDDVMECDECNERFRAGDGEGDDGDRCPICEEGTICNEVCEGCCPDCLSYDIEEVDAVRCEGCDEWIVVD